ncbi:hypothetical protein ACFL5O_08415 [Myxococcota bacterium]
MALGEAIENQTVLLRYRNPEIKAADLEFLRQPCGASWATRAALAPGDLRGMGLAAGERPAQSARLHGSSALDRLPPLMPHSAESKART